MARISARAAAMQLVYEGFYGGDGSGETLKELIEFNPDNDDAAYIDDVLKGVREHAEELDNIIAEHSASRAIDRIARVDLSILRVALYELFYCKDTHESIVINEAVTLANRFSDPVSSRFINGLLGNVVRGKLGE